MDAELRNLYQDVILDHNAHPHNFGDLVPHSHQALGRNPLCGDEMILYIQIEGDVVQDVKFKGEGCAIFKASSSMMTDALMGKSLGDVKGLFESFHEMMTSDVEPDEPKLGKLVVLSGVREFPIRVKCATLAWHTLESALNGDGSQATTE